MESIDKRVVLVTLGLIFIAIWLCKMDFPDYSTEDIIEECLVILAKCEELQTIGASDSEWKEFERTSQEKLDLIVADLKTTLHASPEREPLHQLTKYDIPRAIRSRGQGMEEAFATLNSELDFLEEIEQRKQQKKQQRILEQNKNGTDPLVFCMLAFDGLLAVGVVYLLWPTRTSRAVLDHASLEQRLDLLDKKLSKNPESPILRGVRARLRAEMGLREEAIDDIDWLMERKPHGVDLLALYELREALTEEMEVEGENENEKR